MTGQYSKKNEKIFLLVVSIAFVFLTIFVVKDLLSVIVWSLLLSYLLFPLYKKFQERFSDERISAVLTLLSATIFIFVPLMLFFYFLVLNLIKIIIQYRPYMEDPQLLNATITSFLEKYIDASVLESINFATYLQSAMEYGVEFAKDFFTSIPITLMGFFIVMFITFFLLRDNKKVLTAINEYIPLSLKKQDKILKHIQLNLKYLFKGYFLTGVIQTAVALIGYIIFGVPNILIVTFMTFIVSLVPYLGTPMIFIPAGLYLIVIGSEVSGIGLIIYGVLIISMIDNFMRPYLMSGPDTISTPLVFVGFVGGMMVFGIAGIILGPIIISITSLLLRYLKEGYKIEYTE